MLIDIVGKYKSGKTVSCATFPKPMLFLEIDVNGFSSVRNTKDKDGKLVVPDWKDIDVVSFERKNFSTKMSFVNDMKGKGPVPSHAQSSLQLVNKINAVFDSLIKTGKYNDKEYKTVVLDSMTALFRLWDDGIMLENKQSNIQIQDYKILRFILFSQFIPMIKNCPLDFVLVTSHIAIDKDEKSGITTEFPIGPSKGIGMEMGSEFDEIWKQKIEGGKYVWKTKQDGMFNAGSRLDLPNPIIAHYNELKKYL